jgi:hypothetical protein
VVLPRTNKEAAACSMDLVRDMLGSPSWW